MTKLRLFALLLGATAMFGCRERSGLEPTSSTGARGFYVRTVAGFLLSEAKLQAVYDTLTKDVAKALQDSDVRSMVYERLHASRYPEHKLHFRAFLAGEGRGLLERMASVMGVVPDAVLGTLDSLVDFEFYMPDNAHYRTWDGSGNLIVANELDEDGALPLGFDLSGNAVRFPSHHWLPATPTLAIVPVETDFSNPRIAASAPQRAAMYAGPGLYMTGDYISDLHESGLRGAPEIEIHAFVRNGVGEYVDLQCAGAQQPAPFYFNQDNHYYSGPEVEIIPQSGINTNPVEVSFWEDDHGDPCTGSDGRPPTVGTTTQDDFNAWGSRPTVTISLVNGITTVSFATLDVPLVLTVDHTQYNKDDEVGEARVPSCWPSSSGAASFDLRYSASGHASNGNAALDFTFGQRAPICPLSVTVDGPRVVGMNENCTWTVNASYGTPPYTYEWQRNGVEVGSGQSYTGNTGASSFYLQGIAGDASGDYASEGFVVSVTDTTGVCY